MKEYLEKLQSKGIYTFTRKDLLDNLSISESGIEMNITRYAKRGKIVRIKKGFYTIVPPEYRNSGILPPFWFLDDLMKYLAADYYVALANAAAVYGASHQQPQVFQVIAGKQIKSIKAKNLKIEFIVKSKIEPEKFIRLKKTETGSVRVSSPELTCFDLVRYISRAGGINNAATILQELQSELDNKKLVDLAEYYDNYIYVQRLGYFFERGGSRQLEEILLKYLKGKKSYPVYLVPGNKRKSMRFNKKWKLLVNSTVEPDVV